MQDDDMRIAGDRPSGALRAQTDMGESVAKEFTRHKENGNIFLANRLGEELARPLREGDEALFDCVREGNARQIYFLYGLAVRRGVVRKIAEPILADTALHRFHEAVEVYSVPIYEAISDSEADTICRLYMNDDASVGTVFVKLCHMENSAALELRGRKCYGRYLDFADELAAKFSRQFRI